MSKPDLPLATAANPGPSPLTTPHTYNHDEPVNTSHEPRGAGGRANSTGDYGSVAAIDKAQCLELLETTTVARVAFVGPDGLRLLPVNYRVVDGTIYFRTSETSSLAALAAESLPVLVEVDYHDRTFQRGWSVLVAGSSLAVDRAELRESIAERILPWAGGHRPLLITIEPSRITGRRVRVHHP